MSEEIITALKMEIINIAWQNRSLRSENDKLRKALQPFADKAHFHQEGAFWMDTAFTVEECRAAAAALKETGE